MLPYGCSWGEIQYSVSVLCSMRTIHCRIFHNFCVMFYNVNTLYSKSVLHYNRSTHCLFDDNLCPNLRGKCSD